MPLAKPLCRVCERPTADGAVQAVQLDKEKLQTWCLKVCGYEFAVEIEDEDLICNFCIWHAEFLAKRDCELEALAWWPPDLVYLDDKVKELTRKYLEGKVEQCWVQLEKIELPKNETEENGENEARTEGGKSGKKCFYCGKVVTTIRSHVRYMHENAIRCEYHRCATYFDTVKEKETHIKEVHEKKLIKCNFCESEFRRSRYLRNHIRRVHSESRVRCKFFGCLCYFKSEPEMRAHFEAVHQEEDIAKVYHCHYCQHKSKSKWELLLHISRLHLPKSIKCDKCHKMFSTKQNLAKHVRQYHNFRVCSICNSDVIAINMSYHLKRGNCKRCKNEFECLGLYKSHWKTCRQNLLKCQKCPKTYQFHCHLKRHLKINHRNISWRGLKYKNLGFECKQCKKRFYKNAVQLKIHLNHTHKRLNLKHCAHCCPKSFPNLAYLENHLAMTHFLIEPKFECDHCEKKFISSSFLDQHKGKTHLEIKILEICKVCGKSLTRQSLKRHLLAIHGIDNP